MPKLTILPVSTRNAPGLLTWPGWQALHAARETVLSCRGNGWQEALDNAGVAWRAGQEPPSPVGGDACWLLDRESTAFVGAFAAAREAGWDAEKILVLEASPLLPGAEAIESVRVMDVLRSEGGDLWSAQQTHASLARYLLEETHEVLELLDSPQPEREELLSELGDILFQLVFHARLGQEAGGPWNFDDVARALNEKMYRRNPHVFQGDGGRVPQSDLSTDEIVAQWHLVKKRETKGKQRALDDSLPLSLPALQRAWKIAHRARQEGLSDALWRSAQKVSRERPELAPGLNLLAEVIKFEREDVDLESSLRALLSSALQDMSNGTGSA
ncbi:tetrapyrrole methyltransferase [Dermabacteraceae bacterium TAE3-ERU27]|nr:tetrapyrrole methyltransferase [Dermabacteraceae bacterium TAE3-ERU27]